MRTDRGGNCKTSVPTWEGRALSRPRTGRSPSLPRFCNRLRGIYVFEFKFAKSAKAAIKQCHERNCAAAFAGDPRPVHYVGVNYSPRKSVRTVNDVVCGRVYVPRIHRAMC